MFCKPAMEVLNAVNLVCGVHCEGNPVQALLADNARETGGVVRLSSCPEHINYWDLVNHVFEDVQTSRCGRGWAWSTCSTSPRCSYSTSGTMACCRSPHRRAGQGRGWILKFQISQISPKIMQIKNIGIPNMSNLSKTHVPCRNSNIRDQNQEY